MPAAAGYRLADARASGRSSLFTVESPPLLLFYFLQSNNNPISLRMHPVGGYERQGITTRERPATNKEKRKKKKINVHCRLEYVPCGELYIPVVVVVVPFTTQADLQPVVSELGTLRVHVLESVVKKKAIGGGHGVRYETEIFRLCVEISCFVFHNGAYRSYSAAEPGGTHIISQWLRCGDTHTHTTVLSTGLVSPVRSGQSGAQVPFFGFFSFKKSPKKEKIFKKIYLFFFFFKFLFCLGRKKKRHK